STAYYLPTPISASVLALMRRIDELHVPYPFAGVRMLRDLLRQDGQVMGRRHLATLMRRMGITAPCTASPAPLSGIPPTRSIPLSCATWRSRIPTRSGQRISPIFRYAGTSCTCLPSWTGRVVGCWHDGSPIR
ncbi:MAG: Transposase of family, partial [Nitrospira sp.]|nr:Transposase of family [Nitrospira sp.]